MGGELSVHLPTLTHTIQHQYEEGGSNMYRNNYPGGAYPSATRNTTVLLEAKWGDVTGDGVPDYVYLTGNPPAADGSPFTENIRLHVMNGRTRTTMTTTLQNDAGYEPQLFLGDFTGDHVDEVLVSIQSGGSGAFTYNEMYSYLNNSQQQLYTNDWFYEKYSNATVTYEDQYKVRIVNRSLGKEYLLDISLRDQDYLSQLYTSDGNLKEPTQGSVMGVSGAYPIDLQGDGVYELWPFQRVIGLYNADGLGYLQTPLSWDQASRQFKPVYQWASVYGKDI